MAKMWRRTLRDNDDDDDDDDDGSPEMYRRPRIEARQYDPDVLERFSGYEDDDDDSEDPSVVDELLAKIRKGKYKPKRRDHWSLHVAYNLIQNRGG